MNTIIIEEIRSLISQNEIIAAINKLQLRVDKNIGNKLQLLKKEFETWETDKIAGLSPSEVQRNKIVWALIRTCSYLEIQGMTKPSKKLEQRYEVEKSLEYGYEKLWDIYNSSASYAVLPIIMKEFYKEYEEIMTLTQVDNKPNLKINELISQIEIGILSSRIISKEEVEDAFIELRKNPKVLADWSIKNAHHQASISLLENRVHKLEKFHSLLTKGGILGLGLVIGGLVSKIIPLSEETPFGKGYDKDGYDANGRDYFNLDNNGKDPNGRSYEEIVDEGIFSDNPELLDTVDEE